jgi:pyruvate/2-oxoglutarate/acetoin dehydrogenase E1 component
LVEQTVKNYLKLGIDCEIIDVQSLLPFIDINEDAKVKGQYNRLLVITVRCSRRSQHTYYNKSLEKQNGYQSI